MEKTLKNASILIVDDTPKNIQLLGTVLKDTGYRVIVATNGFAALSILEKTKPDLILLDVMMPEMNGFETSIKIKENKNWNEIPIIFLTAKTEPEDVIKGFELGAVDYIFKPFHANELLARVKTHLELKISRELIQTLLDFQKGIVLMVDQNRILHANQSFFNFTQINSIQEFNDKFNTLWDFFEPLEKFDSTKSDFEYRIKIKSEFNKQNIFLVQQTNVPGKNFSILNLTDITDFEVEKTSLEERASTDELTKLFNRNKFQLSFQNILQEYQVNQKVMSLIIFDIDHFKRINDTFGHNTGDIVLVNVTAGIKNQIRNTDILCRWGGEEFLLLLLSSNLEDAFKIGEKIRIFTEKQEFIPNHKVTISLGITEFKANDTLETFVSRADKALYVAKSSGRNRTEKN